MKIGIERGRKKSSLECGEKNEEKQLKREIARC